MYTVTCHDKILTTNFIIISKFDITKIKDLEEIQLLNIEHMFIIVIIQNFLLPGEALISGTNVASMTSVASVAIVSSVTLSVTRCQE